MAMRSHVRSLLPTWLVTGVGVLVALATGILLQRAERADETARFEGITNTHLRLFERRVMEAEMTLESLGRVFALSPDLSREDFRSLADGVLKRQPGLQALQWVPLVRHENRVDFESRLAREGLPRFHIFNRTEGGVVIADDVHDQPVVVFDNATREETSMQWRNHTASMTIHSQHWDFYYSASDNWSGRSSGWPTWLAVLGLAGCAGALALHVQSTADQNAKISRLVETRTTQLEQETIERLHRQERLAETEARYSILYNSLPDAVLVVESGTVQILNQAAKTLFQIAKPENGQALRLQDLVAGVSGAEEILKCVQDSLSKDQPFQLGNLSVSSGHGNAVVTVRGKRVLWMGRPAVQLVFQDVTREIEAAERERDFQEKVSESHRLESLGLMAGGIAHDFNNILTGILVNASLARELVHENRPAAQHLLDIEAASLRAAGLCSSMLSYAGKNPKQKSTVHLEDLVADTLILVRASIGSTTTVNFSPSYGPSHVVGDATQLQQVIMNLIINASDAMEGKPGRMDIRIESARYAPEADRDARDFVRLVVSDNGKGMPPDVISRIFDPFFTTKATGRGLGLSAVQGVVRSHEGFLSVQSEENAGTTFTLDFPAAPPEEKPAIRPVSIRPNAPPAMEGRILLAEDERLIRLVFEAGLRKSGFEVTACEDGLAAVEEFEKNPASYRLAIVDINMPRLNGHATIKHLHQIRPGLPVIITSGFHEDNVAEFYINKPGFIFLQKPFELKAFMEALATLLGEPDQAPAAL